jgi:hypothetical protein
MSKKRTREYISLKDGCNDGEWFTENLIPYNYDTIAFGRNVPNWQSELSCVPLGVTERLAVGFDLSTLHWPLRMVNFE